MWLCLLGLGLNPGFGQEAVPAIEHAAVAQFTWGQPVEIRAVVPAEFEAVNFYFKHSGIDQFQVRPLVKTEDGSYALSFDTSVLTEMAFDYYLEAVKGEAKTLFPANAPQEVLHVTGQGEALPTIPQDIPTPQQEEAKFRLPVNITGNALSTLKSKNPQPEGQSPQGNGNLRVAVQLQPGSRFGMNVDSNFAYTSIPPGEEKSFDLSNMMLAMTRGAQTLQAGDLNINESEYTAYGLGRRGFDYAFNNQKLYLRAFTASTQQVKGFKGFGLAAPEVRILGGAAGYRFFKEAVSLRAVYVTGKDDPNRGVNVGVPSCYTARRGDVVGIIEETHLFQQALNLRAEFASSRYDRDLGDEEGRVTDNAYQVGGDFRLGAFTGGARYAYVGKDFNSIGLSYISGDRKGLTANLGFMKGILNFQGTYSRDQDNVKNDPSRYTTKAQNAQLNGTLSLSQRLVLTGGYRWNDQRTLQGGVETMLQDSLTNELTGGVSWMPGVAFSMNCMVVSSEITSKNNPASNTEVLTVNAGGSLRAGEILSLCPSASWSRSKYPSTGTTTDSANANVATELFVWPRVLSLAVVGSASQTEMPGFGTSRMFDATAAVNFQVGNMIKFKTITVALKGNFNHQETAGQKIDDYRVFLQGDLAF